MIASPTIDRYERAAQIAAQDGLLDLYRDAGDITVRTGRAVTGRTQRHIVILSVLAMVAGIGLAFVALWALAIFALGIVALLVEPRVVRSTVLLRIDKSSGTIAFEHGKGPSRNMNVCDIASIAGAYETQGWDPRNVLYVTHSDGEREEAIVFSGNDDKVVECCCRVLAQLLEVSATYTNRYDSTVNC
jgi:hypothetical protein